MADRYFHPAALVETDEIGAGTRVWAFAHVMRGAQVGADCNVGDHAFIEAGACVGNNVTLKNNVCVWVGITLDDDVFVGPNVAFTNDRYPRSPRMREAAARYETPERWLSETFVERGVSIGANATIVPGVRIGRYSMVAAGALVTKDVPPFALMAGAPARVVGYVCRCGQKLLGNFRTTSCDACGETPQMRCHQSELEAIIL
ncbi:MAG TPA: acyltransferase [Lacipirellulaceae bacterium]|jgi:acetyltransferase-like isoleucine patch superfamily enzyme|nr:acyltransferase [Lacipirellulaceae bacterium]